ncbi:MAG: biofilm-associated protein [Thaumarchaeota archaeon]|nr:biofilm-associated protein [Nitrososphaerota archaeon]
MNKSSTRGIFLSIILLFSIIVITISSDANAEEINVKSFAFEETTIIEFTNDSDEGVNTFRIWLGSDFSFKSFKTEKGWVGEKTPLGVIIFTSSETIKPGESVKFGVKTDKAKPGINWKALDKGDNQIDTGKVFSGELPKVIQNTKPKQDQILDNTGTSISTESIFRIVPEKPNVGSSIRVTGDQFGASQEFDFYINSKKIGSFETDENGHFMTTMKIPEDQKADRVDFKIKNKYGEEKKISLRIGEIQNRIPESEKIKLTIKGVPDVIHRGDFLEIFGTGDPGTAIISTVTNQEGEIINSRTAEIDFKGNWKLDEPIIIPLDTPFGKYAVTITDGRQSILKHWTVESDKVINIAPINLKFDQGEIMKFNGTALPNKPIEIILEDPLGKEIFSDIIQIGDSGFVEFEFQTDLSAIKGTYTIILTQEKEKEFIFAGVGQLPLIPVNIELDKLNYKTTETVIISLIGKGSDVISLLIIDPSDKPLGVTTSITLEPDGRGTYFLNLEGYSSGVYTAVISKGTTQSTEIFTVGLQTGSGKIEINTTKINYLPGDSILILGDTASNVLLTIILYDSDGNEVKVKETFSDKNGKISESSFRIPSNAKIGTWIINAKSGQNLDTIEIEVLATISEGIQIFVEKGEKVAGIGETIIVKVFGAKQTVEIEIIAEDGKVIETLSFIASSQGEINLPWIIPKETEPGIYTIRATDAFSSIETTFELSQK